MKKKKIMVPIGSGSDQNPLPVVFSLGPHTAEGGKGALWGLLYKGKDPLHFANKDLSSESCGFSGGHV